MIDFHGQSSLGTLCSFVKKTSIVLWCVFIFDPLFCVKFCRYPWMDSRRFVQSSTESFEMNDCRLFMNLNLATFKNFLVTLGLRTAVLGRRGLFRYRVGLVRSKYLLYVYTICILCVRVYAVYTATVRRLESPGKIRSRSPVMTAINAFVTAGKIENNNDNNNARW